MYLKRNDLAVIIEFKKGNNQNLENLAEQALEQITSNTYESSLKDFGYQGDVFCYGVATHKKSLVAKMKTITLKS
jgi:hypothetical protein